MIHFSQLMHLCDVKASLAVRFSIKSYGRFLFGSNQVCSHFFVYQQLKRIQYRAQGL